MTGPGRTLVIMRHAKSSWKTNEADLRRPLSGRGTRDAVVAGQELAGVEFDVVLVSPATRAQQTWQCLILGGVTSPDVRTEPAVYHHGAEAIVDLLRALPDAAHRVLLIGHEPTVSDLVFTLAAHSPATRQLEHFPTSGLAVLTHDRAWADFGPGAAQLAAFKVPRG